MSLTPLTKDQQMRNTLLALTNWHDVKPASVNLEHWRCGTHACFGGHLARWPEFKKLGVRRQGPSGAPYMRDDPNANVANYLFGDRQLFYVRGSYGDDRDSFKRDADGNYEISDYQLVVNRLERHAAKLWQEINALDAAAAAAAAIAVGLK
jgi:hypothetical protein